MTVAPTPEEGQPAFAEAALLGLCPECGARTMFNGTLRFADKCEACGLDYSAYNVGDGPAALIIMLVGAIVVGGSIALQLSQHPPFWLHILLWGPISVLLVVALLRIAKAALLITEHRRQAGDGRLDQ